jgi:hypothetical protein
MTLIPNKTHQIMADKYTHNYLKSLAKTYNIYLETTESKETLYELLLLLDIVDYDKPDDSLDYGIVGWDIPYTPAKWVTAATGFDWNPKLNPVLTKQKTWIFHTEDSLLGIIDGTIGFIRDCSSRFTRLYPQVINLNTDGIYDGLLGLVDESHSYTTALIGWQEHMRFLYHDSKTKTLIFYDPWKSNQDKTPYFKTIVKDCRKLLGYKAIFHNRLKDQSFEGSCVINALARVLMICDHGNSSVDWEWTSKTYDYPIFAARAFRLNMREYHKTNHSIDLMYRSK